MKRLRQMLRISMTERKANEWVLGKTVELTQDFLAAIKRQELNHFGHVIWKPAPCMEKHII